MDGSDIDEFLYGSDFKSDEEKADTQTTLADNGVADQKHDDKLHQSKEEPSVSEGGLENTGDPSHATTHEETVASAGENEDVREEEEYDSESDLEIIIEPKKDATSLSTTIQPGTESTNTDTTNDTTTPSAPPVTSETATGMTGRRAGLNIDAVGQHDGKDIYDYDLEGAEDKPWRKPGADITDYFNYGFNEFSWNMYCARQKQLREDQQLKKKINVFNAGNPMVGDMRSMGVGMNPMMGSMPMRPMGGMMGPMGPNMRVPMGMMNMPHDMDMSHERPPSGDDEPDGGDERFGRPTPGYGMMGPNRPMMGGPIGNFPGQMGGSYPMRPFPYNMNGPGPGNRPNFQHGPGGGPPPAMGHSLPNAAHPAGPSGHMHQNELEPDIPPPLAQGRGRTSAMRDDDGSGHGWHGSEEPSRSPGDQALASQGISRAPPSSKTFDRRVERYPHSPSPNRDRSLSPQRGSSRKIRARRHQPSASPRPSSRDTRQLERREPGYRTRESSRSRGGSRDSRVDRAWNESSAGAGGNKTQYHIRSRDSAGARSSSSRNRSRTPPPQAHHRTSARRAR
ncbi:cleavage polyadenylation factor subunit fip1 [Dispira simplex]|nr:cleavage polyadenylation factor subunit fip1 [Dispira simplex]